MIPPVDRALLVEALCYGSIGGTSASVELGLFYLATHVCGLPVMVSNVAAVASVTVIGFLAQKKFTFRDSQRALPQARLYVLMVGLNFALNNAMVFLFAMMAGMPPVIAKMLQLGISFTFNFSFSKFIVFRQVRYIPIRDA
jgi:putative flippase GtrA